MCHAKPRKRSRLLLSEVDHCLEPFFEGVDKISMPSPSGTAAPFPNGSNTQPHSELGKLDCQQQPSPNPLGGSGPGGTDMDLGGEAASQRSAEYGHSPVIMGASINNDEVATTPPDPPPKQIPGAGCGSAKRIRFTGAMGQFLDGSNVWSDFAIMEAERKANSTTATAAAAVEDNHHQRWGGTEQPVEQEECKQGDKEEQGKGGNEEETGEEEKLGAEGNAGENRGSLAGAGVS